MIEYEKSKELSDAVDDMLADTSVVEFNPIREQDITVFSLMAIRTNTEGEEEEPKGKPITCRKIPTVFAELTEGHYLIVADNYFWNHTDDNQKKAALHHALMQINVEKNKKGEIKLGTRKPEVQEFRSTIARFGAYNDTLLDFRQAFQASAKQFTESKKVKA